MHRGETASKGDEREDTIDEGLDTEAVPPLVGLISRLVGALCIVLLAGILGTILLQIVMRYVVNSPLTWTDEAVRLQLVWLTFLGSILAYRFGSHIAVDGLGSFAARRGWPWIAMSARTLVQTAMMLVSAAFVIGGWQLVAATTDRPTPALGIPVATFYAAVPVCGALVLVSAAEQVLSSRTRRKGSGS